MSENVDRAVRAFELARDQINQGFVMRLERNRNPQSGMINPEFNEDAPNVDAVVIEAEKIMEFLNKHKG